MTWTAEQYTCVDRMVVSEGSQGTIVNYFEVVGVWRNIKAAWLRRPAVLGGRPDGIRNMCMTAKDMKIPYRNGKGFISINRIVE